jgi:hypothetical protein
MDFVGKDQSVKEYLLGTLPAEGRQDIEQSLMTDHELYEYLEAAEDDLIDDYLSGTLSAAEKTNFEKHFLVTPERHQSLRFARILRRYSAESPAPEKIAKPSFLAGFWSGERMGLRAAVAFAVILIIAGGVWIFRNDITPPRTYATLQLNWSVTSTRGDGPALGTVKIPPGTDDLKITLTLPPGLNSAAQYRAKLNTSEGESKSFEVTSPTAQSLEVVIPTSQLPRGPYALNLYSVNPDGSEQRVSGSYFFTVE